MHRVTVIVNQQAVGGDRLLEKRPIDPADVSAVRGICIKCCACVKGCPTGAKFFDDAGYLYHQHELEAQYARPAENEVFYIQL